MSNHVYPVQPQHLQRGGSLLRRPRANLFHKCSCSQTRDGFTGLEFEDGRRAMHRAQGQDEVPPMGDGVTGCVVVVCGASDAQNDE